MFGLGLPELLIFLLVLLLIFGATRLPKVARSVGAASKELRQGIGNEPTDCPFCQHRLAPDYRFCSGCGRGRDDIQQELAKRSAQ